jgi:hypothetical protein
VQEIAVVPDTGTAIGKMRIIVDNDIIEQQRTLGSFQEKPLQFAAPITLPQVNRVRIKSFETRLVPGDIGFEGTSQEKDCFVGNTVDIGGTQPSFAGSFPETFEHLFQTGFSRKLVKGVYGDTHPELSPARHLFFRSNCTRGPCIDYSRGFFRTLGEASVRKNPNIIFRQLLTYVPEKFLLMRNTFRFREGPTAYPVGPGRELTTAYSYGRSRKIEVFFLAAPHPDSPAPFAHNTVCILAEKGIRKLARRLLAYVKVPHGLGLIKNRLSLSEVFREAGGYRVLRYGINGSTGGFGVHGLFPVRAGTGNAVGTAIIAVEGEIQLHLINSGDRNFHSRIDFRHESLLMCFLENLV